MKFKKDWSLAYFIYYICLIGYWLILLSVITQSITLTTIFNSGSNYIHDIPVNIELKQFSKVRDIELPSAKINMPQRISAQIGIETTTRNFSAYLFYNGLKLYKALIFFIVLFYLSKALKNVAEDNPFHPKNPLYLYIIGWSLFISSLINAGISLLPMPLLSSLKLPKDFTITSLDMVFGENFMIGGIFVIVLGYVFKEGARIYEEQKLTV